MPYEVKLSLSEIRLAAYVGVTRRLRAIHVARQPFHGIGEDTVWQCDIIGAIGEMAVSKMLDVYWRGAQDHIAAGDVAPGYEVRSSSWATPHLLLYESDGDDARYYLVSVPADPRRVTVHGWIYGRDGKHSDYWGDPKGTGRKAYWVPIPRLYQVEAMP